MKSWAYVLRLRAPSGVGDPVKKYSKDGSQVKFLAWTRSRKGLSARGAWSQVLPGHDPQERISTKPQSGWPKVREVYQSQVP
jgi:hypothetical protein